MSINRLIDKEGVVHVYDGILLSHKKEQNNAICSNVDGPRDYHIREASQTQKDKYHMISLICGIKNMTQMNISVMFGCESWTIKKAEHQRIDAFELWCWRRLLRVPWTARRSNKFILKEISPEYSLEGLMLKLKLQYFGHLMRRTDSLEKTLILEKIEDRRRKGRQRMR